MEILKYLCFFALAALAESKKVYMHEGETFRVDAGVMAKIVGVEITPSEGGQLKNFIFEVSTDRKPEKVAGECSGKEDGTLTEKKTYTCDPPLEGRYITLRSPGAKFLFFKEMLVQGTAIKDNPTSNEGKDRMKECTRNNQRQVGLAIAGKPAKADSVEDCADQCRRNNKCAGASYIGGMFGVCYQHFGLERSYIQTTAGWSLYRKQCRDDYSKQCTLPYHKYYDDFNVRTDRVKDPDACAELCRSDESCAASTYTDDVLLKIFGAKGWCERHSGMVEKKISYRSMLTSANSLYLKSCKHDCMRKGVAIYTGMGSGKQGSEHTRETCHETCKKSKTCYASSYHLVAAWMFASAHMACYHTDLVDYNLLPNEKGNVYLKICID